MLGDCPTIHVGGAYELFQRVIQHIRLGGLSNILPKLGSVFSRTNSFCFCKTRENFNFFEKGKMVISVENRKFSRYRMTKRIEPLNLSREI